MNKFSDLEKINTKIRKIIVRFLCIFIPLKKWRKNFRKRYLISRSDNNYSISSSLFLEIKTKKTSILKYANKIEELFIGGSQTAYGFIPDYFSDKSFNIWTNSQDSFTCFSLFNVLKKKLPNLKTVFVRYGVFSNGFNLSKSPSAIGICCNYKYLFNIDYSIKNYKDYIKVMKEYDKLPLLSDKNGYIDLGDPPRFDTKNRAIHHLKEHNREIKQDKWIEKLYESAKASDIELIMVIFPCRSDYRDYLPSSEFLFKDIYDLSKRLNIKIFNFYEDPYFINEDFYDIDHLKPEGAIKFTKKLKELYYD